MRDTRQVNSRFAPEAVIGAESAFDPQQTTNVIRLFRPSDSTRRWPKRSIRAYFQPTPTLLVPSSNIVVVYFRFSAKFDGLATGRKRHEAARSERINCRFDNFCGFQWGGPSGSKGSAK